MKKLLVVLLAMVLVLGMATSAYAISYTDTDDLSTTQLDAVYRLSALGVLNGYTDGTFLPANSVTRAEFAKIACVLAGLGDVSDTLKGTPSSFSDVAVNMWYTGYVNIAASQGFINGYSDGTFKPNKTISMAEVVTILMRIAGYNDNLAGPWPFDYIAEAGKQDVTDDVTFVSNTAATRADVAVMANNLLDVAMVNWDSDTSDFVYEDDKDYTVLDDAFEASVYDDAIFDNDPEKDDATDCWSVNDIDNVTKTGITDEDDDPIALTFYADVNGDGDYNDTDEHITNKNMDPDCYIAGGLNLTDLSGMVADIIVNDDDEVIYIKVNSSVVYSDDVSGSISADNLEINDDDYDVNEDFAPSDWHVTTKFNDSDSGYGKVFINDDGDAYAVADLYATMADDDDISGSDLVYGSAVFMADSYADDELDTLDDDSVDFDDYDVVCYKDGEFIDPDSIEQMDVVSIIPANGDADYLLLVTGLVEGTLKEGDDDDATLTVDDTDYYFGLFDDSWYNTEGGTDGDYAEITSVGDDDFNGMFGESVGVALYRTNMDIAYMIATASDSSSRHIYGIVTDITVSGLYDRISDVTVLNQDGEEVTYDLSDDDILTYDDGGADDDTTDIDLGAYVELYLDSDGEIDSVDTIILVDDYADAAGDDGLVVNTYTGSDYLDISGSKIKIDGTWYKVTDNTLFFETKTEDSWSYGDVYDSEDDWDEADLISNDDILSADEIDAEGLVIASHDGSTLKRVFIINSDISGGNESYSFVDKKYSNSDGDFVKMLDGTTAETKSGQHYDYDTFYSYDVTSDEMKTTELFAIDDSIYSDTISAYPNMDNSNFWVEEDGDIIADDAYAESYEDLYCLDDLLAYVSEVDGNTVKINGEYFEITDDTVFYEVDKDRTADTADDNDIDDGQYVVAVSDEHNNLLYVIIFDDVDALNGASVDATPDESMTEANLDEMTIQLDLTDAEFDVDVDEEDFVLNNAPDGLTIESVLRDDSNTVTITLAFDGTNFDDDIDDFSITAKTSGTDCIANLTTANMDITAVAE